MLMATYFSVVLLCHNLFISSVVEHLEICTDTDSSWIWMDSQPEIYTMEHVKRDKSLTVKFSHLIDEKAKEQRSKFSTFKN